MRTGLDLAEAVRLMRLKYQRNGEIQMTDCKKLIMGFGYRNGKAFSWNGKLEYEGRLKDLARTACDNGADEIFICDRSFSDEDHEAVIGAIKETARTVDEPYWREDGSGAWRM